MLFLPNVELNICNMPIYSLLLLPFHLSQMSGTRQQRLSLKYQGYFWWPIVNTALMAQCVNREADLWSRRLFTPCTIKPWSHLFESKLTTASGAWPGSSSLSCHSKLKQRESEASDPKKSWFPIIHIKVSTFQRTHAIKWENQVNSRHRLSVREMMDISNDKR